MCEYLIRGEIIYQNVFCSTTNYNIHFQFLFLCQNKTFQRRLVFICIYFVSVLN